MNYRIEAETIRGSVVSRVYFKGYPETSRTVEGSITVQRLNNDTPTSCLSQTVYIKVCLTLQFMPTFYIILPSH